MTGLPKPPVPKNADLRHFREMPLDVIALEKSGLAAEGDFADNWVAVRAWCAAWHHIPAGSLPDDDFKLSNMLGFGRDVRSWKKYRAGALRGFVKCCDGLLYHPIVVEKVLAALKKSRAAQVASKTRWGEKATPRLKQAVEKQQKPKSERISKRTTERISERNARPSNADADADAMLGLDRIGTEQRREEIPPTPTLFETPEQVAFSEYNDLAMQLGFSVAEILTKERSTKLKRILRKSDGPERWARALSKLRTSWWCSGKAAPDAYRPNLDFLLKPEKFQILIEGGYDDRGDKTINGKTGEIEHDQSFRVDDRGSRGQSAHEAHASAFARAAAKRSAGTGPK